MDVETTLRHIEALANENTKGPMDGYAQIAEWAYNQLRELAPKQTTKDDVDHPTPRKET